MGNHQLRAHAVFGDASRVDGVPDCPAPSSGPVCLEGRLVLSLSFEDGPTEPTDAPPENAGDLIERYRLWDDIGERWHDDLEVQRFEWKDVVVRPGREPAVLWQGAIDTRARVISVPDLDEAGMTANRACDLRWKRV